MIVFGRGDEDGVRLRDGRLEPLDLEGAQAVDVVVRVVEGNVVELEHLDCDGRRQQLTRGFDQPAVV